MKNKLAIYGGDKILKYNFKNYNTIGLEEIKAVTKVLKSGKLSPFLGDWGKIENIGNFYGGDNVNKFEEKLKKFFNVRHAITVNSWTSGLIVAVGSLDIEPGDEIIVPTWTMSATVIAIVNWLAIPVFCDVDPSTYNIDISLIEEKITKKTKAIMITDIFGQSCDIDKINKIAKKYKLKVIADSAQSITSKYKKKYTGTLTDIGGFSLNYHKQIQTGEGGVVITNDDKLAFRMQLIRNHGEVVVSKKRIKNINNIIGYNFRMGEIEAAIGIEQLKKVNKIIRSNVKKAKFLKDNLSNLDGLIMPYTESFNSHVYYYFAMQINKKIIKTSRDAIFNALKCEGVPIFKNYTLVHQLPMYKRKIAYGKNNFPWSLANKKIINNQITCPNAEYLNNQTYLAIPMCNYDYSHKELKLIVSAFKKVWKYFIKFK